MKGEIYLSTLIIGALIMSACIIGISSFWGDVSLTYGISGDNMTYLDVSQDIAVHIAEPSKNATLGGTVNPDLTAQTPWAIFTTVWNGITAFAYVPNILQSFITSVFDIPALSPLAMYEGILIMIVIVVVIAVVISIITQRRI